MTCGAALRTATAARNAWAEIRSQIPDTRLREQVTPDLALAWLNAGVHTGDVVLWLMQGVLTPGGRPTGLSPTDCRALSELLPRGVPSMRWRAPTEETAGWAGITTCCTTLVLDFLDTDPGAHPAGVVELARLLTGRGSHGGWCGRSESGRISPGCNPYRLTEVQRQALAGLDLSDVATCLRAGMGIEEASEHVRDRRDMEPVRVLAALA